MKQTNPSIRHRVEIEAAPGALFDALTQPSGLASWWTPDVDASPTKGAVAQFRFGGGGGPDMRVDDLVPDKRVQWTCIEGPWKSMTFEFDIEPSERGVVLRFVNAGWPDDGDFFMHCNAKWGFFLAVSLKSYLETGRGTPHPNEPSI